MCPSENRADQIPTMRAKRLIQILLLALLLSNVLPLTAYAKPPSKGSVFFCTLGRKTDDFLMRGLDTTYIALPEHSWRVALTNGEMGINSTYRTWIEIGMPIDLVMSNRPSIELGFNVGYRGFGFGYSWDLMNAYTKNWNLSFGSKSLGIEFIHHVTSNLDCYFVFNNVPYKDIAVFEHNELQITNTSLNAWYALNSPHYSHNAAIKQSYIQKRTAGSLLLSLGYMSTRVNVVDSLSQPYTKYYIAILNDGVKDMITRQVAVGIGYGINYTPNHGKVLLHASANMQLVCYSVNHVSLLMPDSLEFTAIPYFVLQPINPVHVTGNMRAAISWEINKWVHLSAWAQANNIQFSTVDREVTAFNVNSWHWQAHINIGVRLGVGKKRIQEILGEPLPDKTPEPEKKSKLPEWLTGYFFSPSI